jgi:hypothetical protein
MINEKKGQPKRFLLSEKGHSKTGESETGIPGNLTATGLPELIQTGLFPGPEGLARQEANQPEWEVKGKDADRAKPRVL